MIRSAVISPDGMYRYRLIRQWGDGPFMTWVMLNPSTADAEKDDATIRACIRFAQREGCGGITVVNLFAYRATDPNKLLTVSRIARGPMNHTHVQEAIEARVADSGPVVLAWGAWWKRNVSDRRGSWWDDGLPRMNVEQMIRDAGLTPLCLGLTKNGSPRHPCRLPNNTPLVEYQP